ncbi:MAG: hypothetical protein AB7O71_24245 [Hyphomicrobiaceae bacterium]
MPIVNLAEKRRLAAAERALVRLGFIMGRGGRWLSPLEIVVAAIFRHVGAEAMAPLPDPDAVDYASRVQLQMAGKRFTQWLDGAPITDAASVLQNLGAVYDGKDWSPLARLPLPELEAMGVIFAGQLSIEMCETASHLGPDDPLSEEIDTLLHQYEAVRYTVAEQEQRKRKDAGIMSYRDFLRYGLEGGEMDRK